MPDAYRLPLLVLDATGMPAEELEQPTWYPCCTSVACRGGAIGEHVRQRDLAVTANTHVLAGTCSAAHG